MLMLTSRLIQKIGKLILFHHLHHDQFCHHRDHQSCFGLVAWILFSSQHRGENPAHLRMDIFAHLLACSSGILKGAVPVMLVFLSYPESCFRNMFETSMGKKALRVLRYLEQDVFWFWVYFEICMPSNMYIWWPGHRDVEKPCVP